MHGSTSGSLLLVNAEVDSMGGVIDGGVEISSTPSLQQSSDLEKTQAELRQTFTAAEKFRRELEFLQKGGDPLDLKTGTAASVSVQSTSLIDQHPEQFVTSEVKGSFAVTPSPHGDSAESSGRPGAPSLGELNSADNLMLFDGDNKFRQVERRYDNTENHDGHNAKESGESVALELPKKSYKRRIRSRPNRDGARSSSTDVGPPRSGQSLFPSRHASRDTKGSVRDADSQEKKYLSNSNSLPKSPNATSMALKHVKLNGTQTLESTLGPGNIPFSSVSDDNASQHHQENIFLTSNIQETPLSMSSVEPGSLGRVEQETLSGSVHPPNADTQTAGSGQAQTGQSLDDNNKNELSTSLKFFHSNGALELKLAAKEAQSTECNDFNTVKDDKILNVCNDNSSPCLLNENGPMAKVENGSGGSESALQNEFDGCTTSETNRKHLESTSTLQDSIDGAEQSGFSQVTLKLATKEHEDSILKEARIIEAKRRRIAGLSVEIFPLESRNKSQWDFVLEEMSWLANDFAQERLWKVTAAAQISRRVAFTSRVRFQEKSSMWNQKEVAHTLAGAVMEFWHTMQVKREELELEGLKKDSTIGLRKYAMRFLEYKSSHAQHSSAQAPVTPDRISDLGILDVSWDDNLTEENLFYTVPPGAIEAYRKSIESHLLQRERSGSSMQEEVDTSGYDAVADNTLEEDEGETSTYYLPGAFEGSKSSKAAQNKRKHFKSSDLSFMQSLERSIVTQPSVLSGKRPTSSINVSIPTKRVRTASRQRFTGPSGCIQALNRADASSGDTNSFQDEQSSLHGGYQMANNMDAESVGDYEKQLHLDFTEVSNRPKKKKKSKHPGSALVPQWQLDSNFHNEQKDHSKRRLDAHQFGSNGNLVASQMSDMSNPNKIMKLLVRDRGRKAKSLKLGSGSPWSLFEDQALVVLVHDMGPNWELISDAINSTLQFKCISRKSNECKERHKMLLERNTGDGADSAEDLGSSQPYPSALPGIPEGSARQLFQRLQGPMEEDTLKSHFEKIIMIGRKQHYRKAQNDNQDPKQLQQPHPSHAVSLSQVCPNNLNGGPLLTPLDLCDALSSSPDFLPLGYQGPHSGGLPVSNQGNIAPMAPSPSSTSSLPGSSNVVLGSHLPAASGPHNLSVRDGRYGIPRTASLSTDEQQRMQQYNQMLSARNMQQSNLPPGSHSGTDRGVRMTPSGNSLGVMSGMNRNMPMARPGFQGITSPSVLPSGSMGAGPGQGNSVRSREPMHMMRPNQNTDHQRPLMAPDLHMQQVTQPPIQPYPHSPHVLNNNSHPRHLHGPPSHATSAYGIRFIKDRQLQQQRLLQQQHATSNPMSPRVTSPQNSTQIQSQSSPLVRNPQTSGNQRRQHPKGGRGVMQQNIPANPSLSNGFSGQLVAGKGEPQQKRYSVQPQAASSSTPPKLVNQKNVFGSSSAVLDSAAQVGAPRSSSPGTGSDHSGPAVNHGVVSRQSSSDGLQRDGVPWQQQPSS